MIIYFSATGNCKHTAKVLAQKTEDEAKSILEFMNGREKADFRDENRLGIIAPTYGWRLPSIVREFIQNTEITVSENTYVYFVSTYGTSPGATVHEMRRLLREKNIEIDSVYSIRMPDTWTPIFNLSDARKVEAINAAAESEIAQTAESILAGDRRKRMKWQLPSFTLAIAAMVYDGMRRTANLYVESNCTGCGLCERKCPVKAIEIKDGRPVWIKQQCTMCLGCLHRCPVFAIQYGRGRTKKHGQYINPHTKM